MPFKKGQSGNPKGGRPKSDVRIAFEKAVKTVEKEKKKKFFIHVVECAWTDVSLMKEVLKKLVPDLKQYELEIEHGITDELANLLRLIDGSSKGKLPDRKEAKDAGK